MNAVAFHAVNLALHLGAVALVFVLINRALRLSGADDSRANLVAALTTLLWSLHPALTDTVSYVSGRSLGWSGLLVLAAVLAGTGDRHRPVLAFACAALAPLTRETALVAPVLLLAFQITVGHMMPQPVRRSAPVWIGALIAAAILAAMPSHRDLVGFSLDQRGPLDALPEILRLWVMPWDISILPTQTVTHGWTDPPTLIRSAGLALATGIAIALRHKAPVVAFAVLWTLLALLPTNSVIWRVDPVAVRPLYLAGIGVLLLAASGLARLPFGRWPGLALAVGLATMSWERATLYQDAVALFADAAAKAPSEARAHLMYGLIMANAGRGEEARAALQKALELDPFQTEAENALRLLDLGAPIYTPPP